MDNPILSPPPLSLLTLQLFFAFAQSLLLTKLHMNGLLFIPTKEFLEDAMSKLLQEDDRDNDDGGSDHEGARGDPREWSGDVAFDCFDEESACGFGKFDRIVLGDVLDGR